MEIRKAQKSKSRLRIGISGTSGSGKTYSALLLASGLTDWKKVCIIDTENGSADLYDNLGEYNVITLIAPFSPERYIEAIKSAENAGMEVIIIDSVTHEWDGKGGCLESNELIAQSKFKGNTWAAWSHTTPRHQKFIDAIVSSSCHVITTARSKSETVQIEGKVKKVGTKDIQREGFEYELTLGFTIDRDSHLASASKDRTEMFIDIDPFVISKTTGQTLKKWAETGVDMEQLAKEEADKKIQEQVEKQKKYKRDKEEALTRIVDLLIQKGREEFSILGRYKKKSLDEFALPDLLLIIEKLESLPDADSTDITVDPDEVDAGIKAQAKK